jgi:hypothetical protein
MEKKTVRLAGIKGFSWFLFHFSSKRFSLTKQTNSPLYKTRPTGEDEGKSSGTVVAGHG